MHSRSGKKKENIIPCESSALSLSLSRHDSMKSKFACMENSIFRTVSRFLRIVCFLTRIQQRFCEHNDSRVNVWSNFYFKLCCREIRNRQYITNLYICAGCVCSFFFFPESIRFIKRNFKLLYVKFGREERERIRILRLSFTIIDDFDPLDSAASS